MKKYITAHEAASMVKEGMTIMIGGFLVNGSPIKIIDELVKINVKNIKLICNDTAFPDRGIGKLIANHQISKLITSHIGTNPSTIEQLNNKEIEIEFIPQGTLIERIRCGGAGLGGILTPTGLGTIVENGKQKVIVNGKEYLIETALRADIAFVGASLSDEEGNLVHKGTSQNFNPLMASAADIVVAEANEYVKTGKIEMENIHTPAIFVDYLVKK